MSEYIAIISNFTSMLGPWCADRAAFALLIKIENLKVKTPYERHYLLLCMVSTVMVNVRALCDQEFETLSDNESIYAYSTPRVLRLLQVLKTFKPDTVKKQTDVTTTATTSPVHTVPSNTPSLTQPSESSAHSEKTISCSIINNSCDNSENLDSKCVSDSPEQYNVASTTIASTDIPVTEINNTSVTDTSTSVTSTTIISTSLTPSISDTITNNCTSTTSSSSTVTLPTATTAIRPWKGRVARGHRKGGPNIRTRPNYFTEPDSLCAVVFVEKRFTAKILYYLINVCDARCVPHAFIRIITLVSLIILGIMPLPRRFLVSLCAIHR